MLGAHLAGGDAQGHLVDGVDLLVEVLVDLGEAADLQEVRVGLAAGDAGVLRRHVLVLAVLAVDRHRGQHSLAHGQTPEDREEGGGKEGREDGREGGNRIEPECYYCVYF